MKYIELPILLHNILVYFTRELLHRPTSTLDLRIVVYIYAGHPANIWRSYYGYEHICGYFCFSPVDTYMYDTSKNPPQSLRLLHVPWGLVAYFRRLWAGT